MKQLVLPIGLAVISVVVAIFVIAIVSHPASKSNNTRISIVAAENFYGNIASQIGGDRVTVTSILNDPNTDPHLYESDARNAVAVSNADIVIENGLGYDDFMDKLLATANRPDRTVLSAAVILEVSGNDANPHLWYDIPHMPKIAQAIEQALSTKDPADQALFAANLGSFNQSLQPALSALAAIKEGYANEPVGYTERVPGYLLADADLRVASPAGFAQAIEEGNEPNPADTLAFQQLIARHQIELLLYNSQVISSATQSIRNLARQANIPVVGVSETMPAHKTYQNWQLSQNQAILAALKGTSAS